MLMKIVSLHKNKGTLKFYVSMFLIQDGDQNGCQN